MNNGWIKLHRKILDNPISSKPNYAWLWITLLLLASHSDKKFIFNNKEQILKSGQLLTGRKELSKKTGIAQTTVERILNYLENGHQIGQQKNNKFRLITILNWNTYQNLDIKSDIQRTSSGHPADIQRTHTRSIKNDKNEKETIGLAKPISRNSFKYSKEWYKQIIDKYQELKGITLQGNEFLPVEQTCKSMFMAGRLPEDIIACMEFINSSENEVWSNWTLNTIKLKMPLFIGGKLNL